MSTTFFAGNDKIIALAIQVDQDTPAAAPTQAWRVYNWTKDPVRAISALEESDSSQQQGASHVTAIGPGFACDLYLRASEFDLIAQGLLGLNDDSATTAPSTHLATPVDEPVFFTVWDIEPYATTVYDGCVMASATLTGTDEGQTEWRVTGLTFVAMGVTHGEAEPADVEDLLVDEVPLIWAETAISYAGAHPGTTSAMTLNINRNTSRVQGDSGFRAKSVVHGKLQVDGQFTRYVADDDELRRVDTGTAAGTDPTSTIYSEALRILITRGTGAATRAVRIDAPEVAHETRETVNDYAQGRPVGEVIGFRTQPQPLMADNIEILTTNAKATPEG